MVIGVTINVVFTIDRPAKIVWPYFGDFNPWMNPGGYYVSGVVGNLYSKGDRFLGRELYRFSIRSGDEPPKENECDYEVLRIIPEHLLVVHQLLPEDGSSGGVCPGFHTHMFNERDGKTTVTNLMEHSMGTPNEAEAEKALVAWREDTRNSNDFGCAFLFPT